LDLFACTNSSLILAPTSFLDSALNTISNQDSPRFNLDGHYLVLASDRQGKRGIWLYNLIEHKMVPLPGLNQPNTRQDQPDISGNGRYIVYLSEQFGKSDILLYDRQSQKIKNLTSNFAFPVRHPTISGNGRFIAYEVNRSGRWDIAIYVRGDPE
jgi:Tol biopolymer transport system component